MTHKIQYSQGPKPFCLLQVWYTNFVSCMQLLKILYKITSRLCTHVYGKWINFVFRSESHFQDVSLCICKYSKILKHLKPETLLISSWQIRDSDSAARGCREFWARTQRGDWALAEQAGQAGWGLAAGAGQLRGESWQKWEAATTGQEQEAAMERVDSGLEWVRHLPLSQLSNRKQVSISGKRQRWRRLFWNAWGLRHIFRCSCTNCHAKGMGHSSSLGHLLPPRYSLLGAQGPVWGVLCLGGSRWDCNTSRAEPAMPWG